MPRIVFIGIVILLAVHQTLSASSNRQGTVFVNNVWNEMVYRVDTIASENGYTAKWILFKKDGNYEADFNYAQELLKHFRKQSKDQQSKGIFIYSKSYAIFSAEERDQIIPRYKDPKWVASESALIEELRAICQKEIIPLYVNTSSWLGVNTPWRVLVFPEKNK